MSSHVFVLDAKDRPLMPMSAAYARRLLHSGKAHWHPHYAMPIIRLSHTVDVPILKPIVVGVKIHLHTTELLIYAAGDQRVFPLLRIIVDLRTDLLVRLRRRANHRQRRRACMRYRPSQSYGVPYRARRPSMARSRWRSQLRKCQQRDSRSWTLRVNSPSPIVHWRAQAIARTIHALQKYIPISHVVMLKPLRRPELQFHQGDIRSEIMASHRHQPEDAKRAVACSYCGTITGRMELDHILPRARGGTDGQQNRLVACARCNAKKRDRLPEEVGFSLPDNRKAVPRSPNRAGGLAMGTAKQILHDIDLLGLIGLWPINKEQVLEGLPSVFNDTLFDQTAYLGRLSLTVAKPIAQPTKQSYSSRNYSLRTPLRAGYQQIGTTIKRRIRVNKALVISPARRRSQVTVIPVGSTMLPTTASTIIKQGMVCEATRAGQLIVGIVAAIHTAGRLTLLVPSEAQPDSVQWQRIVVSPRQGLRILSNDTVVFFHTISAKPGKPGD